MAVLPNKRQRQLAEFRDRARQAGVTVSLKVLDDIPPRLQRATDDPLAGYGVHLTPQQRQKVASDLFVRTRSGWEAKSGVAIPKVFDRLPECVEIVSIGFDHVTIYWNERGGEEALKAVFLVLATLHPAPPETLTLSQ